MKFISSGTLSKFQLYHPKYGPWHGVGDLEIIGNIYENPELVIV